MAEQVDDAAASMARQYIEAVDLRLTPRILDNGDVMVVPDEVTPTAVKLLANDLSQVLTGNAALRAREASARYGAAAVQAVAFGSIDSFATTVKVGRLYGDRIVFWDILGLQCVSIARIAEQERWLALPSEISEEIASLASSIMSTNTLVDDGAAVFLPHPLAWSEEAREANRRARRGWSGPFFGTEFGSTLATTLAVASDLRLHPYSVADIPVPLPSPSVLAQAMSRENRLLQKSYGEIVANGRFHYLEDISVTQFHKLMLQARDVAEELQTLIGDLGGKTEQQWRRRLEYVQKSIETAVSKQNERLKKQVAEAAGKVAGLIGKIQAVDALFTVVGAAADAAALSIDQPIFGAPSVVAFFARAKWVAENNPLVVSPSSRPTIQ